MLKVKLFEKAVVVSGLKATVMEYDDRWNKVRVGEEVEVVDIDNGEFVYRAHTDMTDEAFTVSILERVAEVFKDDVEVE